MKKDAASSPFKGRNALVIGILLLAVAALILISRLNGQNGPSQEEINSQIANLTTPTPTAASEKTPEATPDNSLEEAVATDAEAYLFIILNNRVWGIEPLGEEREVTVDQGNGMVNVIHLLPDGFYMASSTCENQLCVSQGEVTVDNYQRRILGTSVLCLPNGLDLELVVPSHTPDPNAPDI